MRLIKHHPVLAALLAIVFLGVAAPLTYAAIERVFISIDASETAPEIEHDVQSQLQQNHIQADVQVDKDDDGRVKLLIRSTDPNLGSADLQVGLVNGSAGDAVDAHSLGVQIVVTCALTTDQQAQLASVASSAAFTSLLADRPEGQSDADLIAATQVVLASAGFHDVQVAISGTNLTVTVTAPPHA